MGSELRCQNFDLVKFRQIIPRNPILVMGPFFVGTLSQNFQNPKLESEFWPNSDPSSGLDNLVKTSPRGSCAAF